jgi:PhnB protein
MSTTLNPYLSFRGNAHEAITFYHSVLGGELSITTFAESHMTDRADPDQVMHGSLTSTSGLSLMAADIPAEMELTEGNNISVSLSGDDEATLRGFWDGLTAGGSITVPLEKAPWGDTFGMFTDKFGIGWLVNIAGAQA